MAAARGTSALHEPSNTPVLLLTFNRPHHTRRALEAIRQARPRFLYVASDGPRAQVKGDLSAVLATRSVIDEMINWPCDVKKRYSETNQGCRVGVSSAIRWFFHHVESGIILEDDCVPHPDFFAYCTELLHRYRDNERVMNIAGDNSAGLVLSDPDASYCFSRQPLIWGWATWRRAWARYDSDLSEWKSLRENEDQLRTIWQDPVERKWQVQLLDRLLFHGEPDSWAYVWAFSIAASEGVSTIPSVNLVSNIGFGAAGTHTSFARHPRADARTRPIVPLVHPTIVEGDAAVERQIFDQIHGGRYMRSRGGRIVLALRHRVGFSVRRLQRYWAAFSEIR
jgi:hypothetical protein